jgi:hypothetical protein
MRIDRSKVLLIVKFFSKEFSSRTLFNFLPRRYLLISIRLFSDSLEKNSCFLNKFGAEILILYSAYNRAWPRKDTLTPWDAHARNVHAVQATLCTVIFMCE